MRAWILGATMLWAVGCSCAGPHAGDGLCAGDAPPATCGVECSDTDPCPAGYYCSDFLVCTADCDDTTGCTDGQCDDDGRCVRPDTGVPDDVDAGERRDTGDPNVCADVTVTATRVTPNVILIIDQSGSMTSGFGGSNRWDALRDSLMDRPDGLVAALEDTVRFGVALYSARADGNSSDPVPGECPLVEYVAPALSNYDAIDAVYGPADPIDETPTGASIDAVLDLFTMTPDPSTDPTIFILATDGEPDTCEQPNPQEGQPEALAATRRAYDAGIRTFVISVGRGTVSESHLQDMANAGLGRTGGGPDAEFWEAGDDDGLRDALTDIIGGELSCVVTLEGEIQDLDQACTGRVELNGTPIPCDDPNGWRVIDSTHIELVGDACDTLQSGPGTSLRATFPCDIILI